MKTNIINKPDMLKAANRRKSETHYSTLPLECFENLKKLVKGKSYFVKTYGCQANVRDEETMRGMLNNLECVSVDNPSLADIIIINTCAVRENAEDKVYGEIGNLKILTKKKKDMVLSVCGCMVEQPEILEKLLKTFPEVNLYFGTHEVPNLYSLLYAVLSEHERVVSIESKPGDVVEQLPACRLNKYKAFVNIVYGCNKFCTYCIVPYTRGKERSRKFADVIEECEKLVKEGYKEITLLGQNVNAYGKDLDEGYDFSDLLEAVAKLGIERLRFTTSHPWDFSSKMIDVIAKYPNIMKFIHLPVQSGNDTILKEMGRRYDRQRYLDLVKEMREKIPGLALSTDIIVGFPNETEEEFKDTLSLVDIVKYEAAFTFIYSPRRGTPAAKIQDNVSYETKSKRFLELVKHLEGPIEEHSKQMVGKIYKILVDGPSKTDPTMFSGYSEENKLVHFKGNETMVGQIVTVKITESRTYSLMGELVDE